MVRFFQFVNIHNSWVRFRTRAKISSGLITDCNWGIVICYQQSFGVNECSLSSNSEMEISSIGYYSNFTVSFILFLKSRSCEVIPPMWSMADKRRVWFLQAWSIFVQHFLIPKQLNIFKSRNYWSLLIFKNIWVSIHHVILLIDPHLLKLGFRRNTHQLAKGTV